MGSVTVGSLRGCQRDELASDRARREDARTRSPASDCRRQATDSCCTFTLFVHRTEGSGRQPERGPDRRALVRARQVDGDEGSPLAVENSYPGDLVTEHRRFEADSPSPDGQRRRMRVEPRRAPTMSIPRSSVDDHRPRRVEGPDHAGVTNDVIAPASTRELLRSYVVEHYSRLRHPRTYVRYSGESSDFELR